MTTNLTITTKQNLDKSNTVPMVKGRGATTCLICNKDGDFVMNNVSTVLGIKRLFDTTDFNVLLMCCQICIKCTGRLHQLFDFHILKVHLENEGKDCNTERCSFCNIKDTMTGQHELKARSIVSQTKWRQPDNGHDEIRCCFSCYNYLLLYKKIEATLREEQPKFFNLLTSWKVIVSGTTNEDQVNHFLKSLYESVSPTIRDSDDDTIQVNLRELNFVKVEPEPFVSTVVEINMKLPIVNTVAERLAKPKVRKRKSEASKLVDSSSELLSDENMDKFSSIKMRRSSNRPPSVSTKKYPAKKKNCEIAANMISSISVQENTIQLNETDLQESTAFTESLKIAIPLINISLVDLQVKKPRTEESNEQVNNLEGKSSSQEIDIAPETSEPDETKKTETLADDPFELMIDAEKTLVQNLYDDVNSSLDDNLAAFNIEDVINLEVSPDKSQIQDNSTASSYYNVKDPILESNLMSQLTKDSQIQESSTASDCFNIEEPNLESNFVDQFDLSLFPQIDDIGNEVVVIEAIIEASTESSTKTESLNSESKQCDPCKSAEALKSQDYIERYNLKPLSVVLEVLDYSKILKIVGDRMPSFSVTKVTKSGRVMKPKVIVDPSPAPSKKRKMNEAGKKKNKNSEVLPGQVKRKYIKKIKGSPIINNGNSTCTSVGNTTPLSYPEGDFPDSFEIEEYFVDYSAEQKPSLPNAKTLKEETKFEDALILFDPLDQPILIHSDDDEPPRQPTKKFKKESNMSIEMEFLSPTQKHRGKIVFKNSLLKLVPTRIHRMRPVC